MTSALRRIPIAFAMLLALHGRAVAQADPDPRGQALYESRCAGCHDRSVHQRAARTATSYSGIRAAVERWSREAGARWNADDVDAVARHLNARFYRAPCDHPACAAQRS